MPPCRFLQPQERDEPKPGPSPITICDFCLKVLKPGQRHVCNRSERFENLKKLTSPKIQMNLAKEVVADAIAKAKDVGEEAISLIGQQGRPLLVNIAGKKKAVITREAMAKYRAQFGMSKSRALAQAKFFKEVTLSKLEPYMKEHIFKEDTTIGDFFSTEYVELLGYDKDNVDDDSVPEDSNKRTLKKVMRWVFFCNDVAALVAYLLQIRGIEDEDSVVKIGLDSGRGFLKVLLSVHSKADDG